MSHRSTIKLLTIFWIVLLVSVWGGHPLVAQEQKPKVALVLSGGGAKGLAHIPLLQVLDSLGIVPDLVVGTSMGSVVGGLYALGYSGDSIAEIARNADWEQILSSNVTLEDVAVEEKSEFKQYAVELDIKRKSLKVPQSLIGDQNLKEYLSYLCFPAHEIDDFDRLPIPYRAVAVDIVNGEEVIIDKGGLYRAMRASMAIPSIFKPIEYGNTLLVDGGVLNNFPTDVARELGADIIIGSDVGGGMSSREELEDILTLLFQAGMLQSNLKNPANRALCDVLLDHTVNLTFGTADFGSGKVIMRQGKKATRDAVEELVKVREQLASFDQRPHRLPAFSSAMQFDSVAYTGIGESNLKLVKAKLDIMADSIYEPGELQASMRRAMGTTLFTELDYVRFKTDEKERGLLIKGIEKAPGRVKGSLHYDTERGVGLIFNLTLRNLLGRSSRSIMALDIAESPRLRFQHLKYIGPQKRWWTKSEVYGEQVDQPIYLQGQSVDNFKYRYLQVQQQVNYTMGSAYLGGGINYQYTQSRPKVDPAVSDNLVSLERYAFHNLELNLRYFNNTQDKVYFPTRGNTLRVILARTLTNHVLLERSVDSLQSLDQSINNFTRFSLDYNSRAALSEKTSTVVDVRLGYTFSDGDDQRFSDFGYGAFYLLGGVQPRPRTEKITFPGLRDGEIAIPQYTMIRIALQHNLFGQFYVTPHAGMTMIGYNFFSDYLGDLFSPSFEWDQVVDAGAVVSGGLTLGYNSFIGPFFLDVSRVNQVSAFRFSFGFGFHFNRSD